MFKRAGAIATGKRKKHISPKPRRAHQEEIPPMTTTTTTTTPTTASTTSTTTTKSSEPVTGVNKTEEPVKEVDAPEGDSNVIEIDELLAEATERQEVLPDGSTPDGDSDKHAEECANITEPPTEEEPSVASQLMTSEVEGDNLSVEGMIMSEDEREAVCDAPSVQLVRVTLHALVSNNLLIFILHVHLIKLAWFLWFNLWHVCMSESVKMACTGLDTPILCLILQLQQQC